ncbi:S1 RNA-binding domain-containing protein, partial [Candidatus Kryptonium thompsonii]|uniref:S1 RNA-binding domain-containing protein n=1 Tax=Candidatus Kryptonium thompsonii TaxID=1633631 RepID=UPI001147419E
MSHLLPGHTQIKNIHAVFKEGETLPLKVIEFDKERQKIILSVFEYFKDKSERLVKEFL